MGTPMGAIIASMDEILGDSGRRVPRMLGVEPAPDSGGVQTERNARVSEAAEPLALLAFSTPEARVNGIEREERQVHEPPAREVGFSLYKAEAILASIRGRAGALQGCYVQELGAHRSVRGKMSLTLVVDARGRTRSVDIEEDTLGQPAVEACVRRRIETWRFLVQGGKESIQVRFRLRFVGRSRGPVVDDA